MKDSKKLKIQRLLATGKPITPQIAVIRFNCYSLSQRIGNLISEGWPIQSEWVRTKTASYKKYWIDVERVSI